MRWRVAPLAVSLAIAASCTPIDPLPASSAPQNSCAEFSCDNYEKREGEIGARCEAGRCQFQPAGDRPDYPFWIVVHIPDTSIHAPGSTFVFFSDEAGEPAFKRPAPTVITQCSARDTPQCIPLSNLSQVVGEYRVRAEAFTSITGERYRDPSRIPVRVVYEPTGNAQGTAFTESLPLDLLFDASRLGSDEAGATIVQHSRTLPFGTYLRVLYPLPPYDEYLPPTADRQQIASPVFRDEFSLGDQPPAGKLLDAFEGGERDAVVTREDGLDGWRVWIQNVRTRRRISVLRRLAGTSATTRLFTAGESISEDAEAVVAPPDDWTAVPRFVTPLLGGLGLKALDYPALPPPVPVTGVVAFSSADATLRAVPSKLRFESELLLARDNVTSARFLEYETTVSTDERGRFSTILPPGSYNVTVEPIEGTGFAKTPQVVTVDNANTVLTLEPRALTLVRGKVRLTDGRPVGEAELLATPETPSSVQVPTPRPGRTRTAADGSFAVELDPGPYVFTVIPRAGSGFPRIVSRAEVPSRAIDLAEMRVPAPTPLRFALKDPSNTANPVVGATVRIFAAFSGREDRPVEIGMGTTGPDGAVEILLAQEPR